MRVNPLHIAVLMFSLIVLRCGGARDASVPTAANAPLPGAKVRQASRQWADSVLAGMTIEEKLGQMVMVTAPPVFLNDSSGEMTRLESLIKDWGVGGVALVRGTVNDAALATRRLQALAKVPLLIASDLEHGTAMRFTRGTDFPDAMAFGASWDPELAYEAGRITAREARAIGVNMNFAPVADVNTNPENPVINTRSYGGDAALVSRMVAAFVRGTNDAGVLATVKHFPGHGSTSEDSHLVLPIVSGDGRSIDSIDLAPFRAAIASGCEAVMVGHLAVPLMDSTGVPATLSRRLVTGLLRDRMDFDGLIITDAMGMAGVRVVPPERAAVLAVEAGADVLLLTNDEYLVLGALRDAVRDGELGVARIDSSVRRILLAKERFALPHRNDDPNVSVASPSHWNFARHVARRAVTLIRNEGELLPLQPSSRKILSLILTDSEESRSEVNRPSSFAFEELTGAYFTQLLRQEHLTVSTARLSLASEPEAMERALAMIRRSDITIISLFLGIHASTGTPGIPAHFGSFVRTVNTLETPIVLVSFGSPYAVAGWRAPRAIVCAYSDGEPEQEAVASCLTGDAPIHGRLPVALSSRFPLGFGIALEGSHHSVGDSLVRLEQHREFSSVDSLMDRAVEDSVFPGAQLLVMKNNGVVFDKCFGRFTYDSRSPAVDDSTIYDLASLTKVVATTTAVMRLCDKGLIDLDAPVGRYIQQFTEGEKRRITIRQLLLHRSGFPPFRRLWTLASTRTAALDSAFVTPLEEPPGDSTIYSDINMMALGAVVEHVARVPLDVYARDAVFRPLGMTETCFNPPPVLQWHAAPTEFDSLWRKRQIIGTVHDENASLLGGVSGHAGLFSTASDLARFALMMLNCGRAYGHEIYSYSTYDVFLRTPYPPGERWLGWDKVSPEGSSAGSLFSDASYGHTGFTGTSLWIDPVNHVAVILLTNRVSPSRANQKILRFRPVLHDAVVHALQGVQLQAPSGTR